MIDNAGCYSVGKINVDFDELAVFRILDIDACCLDLRERHAVDGEIRLDELILRNGEFELGFAARTGCAALCSRQISVAEYADLVVARSADNLNFTVRVGHVFALVLGTDIDIDRRTGCRCAVHFLDGSNNRGHDIRLRNGDFAGECIGQTGCICDGQGYIIGACFFIGVREQRVLDRGFLCRFAVTVDNADFGDIISIFGVACIIAVGHAEHLLRGDLERCLRNCLNLERIERDRYGVAVCHQRHDAIDHVSADQKIGILTGILRDLLLRRRLCNAGFLSASTDLAPQIEGRHAGHIRTGPADCDIFSFGFRRSILDFRLAVINGVGIFRNRLVAGSINSCHLNGHAALFQDGLRELCTHNQFRIRLIARSFSCFQCSPLIGILAAVSSRDRRDLIVIGC